ncbi:MAG: 2-dehydropantoate 2-reductase [Akkermansiaceae bacterium]|nr:2-dehydropantoate 2-reductase [Akkermansiaceae bacterium]
MKSFAIVGAGAVGSYYGGRLSEARHDVRFLMRMDCEVVRKVGLTVESTDGDFFLPEVNCAKTSEEIGKVDVVIVAWKATSNEHFEKVITPLLRDDTIILTLQNGLGNIETLGELFGIRRVLGAMCFVCINRLEPGRIRHTACGNIVMGEANPGMTPRLEELVKIFENAKVKSSAVEDFGEAQWRKLVWNIPFNGLCITEGGIDTGTLLAMPDGGKRVRELMHEVTRIAGALGYEIEDEYIDFQIERTYPMEAYKPSSMLDYVNGNPVEIEAIWGEPWRRAQEAGVDSPNLTILYGLIKSMVASRVSH